MSSLVGRGPTGVPHTLKGTGYKQLSLGTLNPEQQSLFSQLAQGAQQNLGPALGQLGRVASGGDESMWSQLEAPALRQFGQLQGSLASRFSGGFGNGMGQGTMGARRSSGFQNTMGEAGADLAERLASQRMGLQQQALSQLLGLSESLLGQRTFDTMLMPKQKKIPLWKKLLGSGVGLAAPIGGALLGGPLGGSLGSQFGSGFSSALLGE